jgi:RecG-like helicase
MSVEYDVSVDPPNSIIVSGEGSLVPFVESMDGVMVDSFDSVFCEIPFTHENATKLRSFLQGKTFNIPERERKILAYLANNNNCLEDKEIRWVTKLTDLKANLLQNVKGVRSLKTEWDLVHYLPLRYLDKSNPQSVKDLILGEWAVVSGTVCNVETNYNSNFVKVVVEDVYSNRIAATFFRQMWLARTYKVGDPVVVYGNYGEYVNKRSGGRFPQITSPKIDRIDQTEMSNSVGYGMLPIYPQKKQEKSWAIKNAQEKLLNQIVWIEDPVPERILKKYSLISRTDAYRLIHFPDTREDMEAARRRIAFDEYVRLQVYIRDRRNANSATSSAIKNRTLWAEQFEKSLPFEFTGAQKRVIKEILGDLNSNTPMYRLLQGDVGSGKALPDTANILTPNGWVTMGDIQVGDITVTPNNGRVTVVGKYPQGVRPIYLFKFEDGSSCRADINHLWLAGHVSENNLLSRSKLVTTQEIMNEGFVHANGTSKWVLPNPNLRQISQNVPDVKNVSLMSFKKIVSITYDGDETASCIKLSSHEGLFITDGYTVTHNTEISSVAALTTAESGYQVAMLAPTDILATQLYERLTATFRKAGITEQQLKIELYTGRVLGKKRKELLERVKNGETHMVVGTHALVGKNVEFSNLGLAIVDEQHKFGSEQRTALRKLNSNGTIPDMLAMSATPIPRTTSQIVYGDMDISVVDELPAERKPIVTEWDETPDKAWVSIREEVEKGHQAYVVAALVEDSDKMENVESATATYLDLANRVFPDMKVGLLHGKLPKQEKQDTIKAFQNKKIDILVATSVIEVGVNIPNATTITILNANRFGIASLHQIRGRVGRGAAASYCFLVGEATVPEAEERLSALVASNDGFWLAEKDLEIRGEGSLFGNMQSGDNDLYVGNLKEHKDLLEVAKKVAKQASSSVLLNHEISLLYAGRTILA